MGMTRRKAIWLMSGAVAVVSVIPMLNLKIFVIWDLTFGSGMQTLGALLTVITAGWFIQRSVLLAQIGEPSIGRSVLVVCIRYLIPIAMLAVGAWWLLTDVLGSFKSV